MDAVYQVDGEKFAGYGLSQVLYHWVQMGLNPPADQGQLNPFVHLTSVYETDHTPDTVIGAGR